MVLTYGQDSWSDLATNSGLTLLPRSGGTGPAGPELVPAALLREQPFLTAPWQEFPLHKEPKHPLAAC